MFWRNPSAAFFNFLLPLLFLALFGAIFAGSQEDLDVIVPGHRRHERDVDDVHRARLQHHVPARARGSSSALRGTPLPTSAYLGGIAGNAVTNTVLQVAIVIVAGHAASSASAGRSDWFALRRVRRRSASSASRSLGVALSHAIPNFESAPAYVNAVVPAR